MIQITLTLKITDYRTDCRNASAVNNNHIEDYDHPDDHASPTYEMTHGFKHFTVDTLIIITGKMS